ncbi:MAG: toprim domain-containing protein [Bacteroidetes bacterium]|nr:toprim domain-containing protein [Bacteroidota bacterium]
MRNNQAAITCEQAREMDIVDYLSKLGFEPKKVRGYDYWYLSPLRSEETSSFKVNRKLNRWYDHGIGKGGNVIDFAVLYHNCTVGEFLRSLNGFLSFHKQPAFPELSEDDSNKIIIKKIELLHSLTLIRYLHSRKIPLHIAEKFCKEVSYEWNSKSYYSIGFLNDCGGYELRNSFCKNSSSPKGITTIKNGAEKIALLEGFFDFLSLVTIFPKDEFKKWDYCILNSLSFFETSKPFFAQYKSIHLFLDNDMAGQNCSRDAQSCDTKYRDESNLYKNYKDLNEWLVMIGKKTSVQPP